MTNFTIEDYERMRILLDIEERVRHQPQLLSIKAHVLHELVGIDARVAEADKKEREQEAKAKADLEAKKLAEDNRVAADLVKKADEESKKEAELRAKSLEDEKLRQARVMAEQQRVQREQQGLVDQPEPLVFATQSGPIETDTLRRV